MKEAIEAAVNVLKAGGIILYPTDTIWGIGCDATNPEAVAKVFKLKQREDSKSLIVLVNNDGMLQRYVKEVPEMAWQLIDITEKPLTIIYDQAVGLAKNAVAEDGSIAIRLVKHDFCLQLLQKFNKPIVSTSANISGAPSPVSHGEIVNDIKNNVDFVTPKNCLGSPTGQPSSIIKLSASGEIKIIRK